MKLGNVTVCILGLSLARGEVAAAQAQSLQEQAICAQQAKTAFEDYNNASSVPGFKLLTANYQSHYNTKLNKCLVLITEMSEMDGQLITSEDLLDAFEHREFADYIWQTKEGKNVSDVPPYCRLTSAMQQEEDCSKEEFDAFVSKYMEQ